MGAEYVEMQVAEGRTVDEAFKQVHDDATWYSGHGGYSGTMAEKGSAVLCGTLPPRMSMEQFSTLASRYNQFTGLYLGETGKWLEYRSIDCGNGCRKILEAHRDKYKGNPMGSYENRPRTCGACNDGRVRKDIIHRTTPIPKRLRTSVMFKRTLDSFIQIADDKWGPAAAVQANKAERVRTIKGRKGLKRGTQVYLFEGYCSS